MTTQGGIHGEGSQKELLLINLGFGPLGIMKLTMLLKLYASSVLLVCFQPLVFQFLLRDWCLYFVFLCGFNHDFLDQSLVISLQGESKPFKPYTHRYHVPYIASGSTSSLWYSIKRASTYIIVMSSYSAYGNFSFLVPFYTLLKRD